MNLMRRSLLVFFAGIVSGCARLIKPLPSAMKLALQLHGTERVVCSTAHWFVKLKRDQTYVGSATIRLRRRADELGSLTHEEWTELLHVVQALEFATFHAFGSRPANWYFEMSCLMNHAYRTRPHLALVHIHFHPRTDGIVNVLDYTFPKDERYGSERMPYTNLEVSKPVEKEVIRLMQKELVRFAELYLIPITLP
ncbi:MAG: hypothetical protein G01um101429_926 [Parcubacteria group bacterium Gr01-1014_29]|nr:MAG: hypothetical protein G01um101429_926 [Parcubacteria group bacterium Gr01-1014_29]